MNTVLGKQTANHSSLISNSMKTLIFITTLLPLSCLAQYTITGRVLNSDNQKQVVNASVFLSKTVVGNKTTDEGHFTLYNAKPGKYQLTVSIVGFETFSEGLTVDNGDIILPDIFISPKIIRLNEVKIKPVNDANRDRYYDLFKDQFLGTSELALNCKILNPEILDFDYNETTTTLTASSPDFLEIENDALGYKIKYLLIDFRMENKDVNSLKVNYKINLSDYNPIGLTYANSIKVHYEGSSLFEEMKGTPSQQRRWQRLRQEAYEGSSMHFLRSALKDRIAAEGFRALLLARHANPERPDSGLIEEKIKFFKNFEGPNRRDSMAFWVKKSKLPKKIEELVTKPLGKYDIIGATNQPGLFALGFGGGNDALYITYNKDHNFHLDHHPTILNDPGNKENTLVSFYKPYTFFDRNGIIIGDANNFSFSGVWGRARIAELLPSDYETPQSIIEQEDNKILDTVISKTNAFAAKHITEKAYLQFDKPYYAAGDTLYFKAYVTMGERHEPSTLSSVLHVNLINTNNKIDQNIKLQLDSGLSWGDFALPDSLPAGNYRVRAYTQWMRNNGDDRFFDQTIAVGSLNGTRVPEGGVKQPVKMVNNKADVQFFPEGGSLVAGIRSKVAFKAIGTNGLGINVKGVVVGNDDKEVCEFESAHLGMGYFYLEPKEGKTYRAKVAYSNGLLEVFDLPKPEPSGIVLSVNNDLIAKATVKVQVSKAYFKENRDKDYTLLINSGGIITTAFCTLDSQAITLNILKRKLHTGIAAFTLFSSSGEPLCERLLFVQNYDRLNLDVKSDKSTYTNRGKVSIKLKSKNRADSAVTGHFSVSVTDENKLPVNENNENTILNNLLLTSELKGYVEQPNYYFTDTSANVAKNLDLLMLTQGYRRFTWRQVLDDNNTPLPYQPEKALEISGKVENLLGKPLANAIITLLPAKGGGLQGNVTDDKGIFHFSNLIFTDTAHFVLSAVNAEGKNSTKITYFNEKPGPAVFATAMPDKNSVPDTTMATYIENTKKYRNELINYGKGKGIMLKEVKIKDVKLDDQYKTQSLAGAGNADQVMHADEIEQIGGQLSTSLNGRLRGVSFVGSSSGSSVPYLTTSLHMAMGLNSAKPMLVVVDGVEYEKGFDVNQLPSAGIETIEVLKNGSAGIYGVDGGGGVLIITTKQGGGMAAKDIASVGVLPIAPVGFYKAREFYSPKYNPADLEIKKHDFRSTIYWNPELVTDKDGYASFEYYNADGTGTYRVVIEGIDDKGNLGRQVYRYSVK